MVSLEEIIRIINSMQAQGIFTQAQATKLINAATAILQFYGGEDEYKSKYQLFLGLIGGKWI